MIIKNYRVLHCNLIMSKKNSNNKLGKKSIRYIGKIKEINNFPLKLSLFLLGVKTKQW